MAAVTMRPLRPEENSVITDLLTAAVGDGGQRLESAVRRYREDPDVMMLVAAANGEVVGSWGAPSTDWA